MRPALKRISGGVTSGEIPRCHAAMFPKEYTWVLGITRVKEAQIGENTKWDKLVALIAYQSQTYIQICFEKVHQCENVAQFSYSVAKEIYELSMACDFVLHSWTYLPIVYIQQ